MPDVKEWCCCTLRAQPQSESIDFPACRKPVTVMWRGLTLEQPRQLFPNSQHPDCSSEQCSQDNNTALLDGKECGLIFLTAEKEWRKGERDKEKNRPHYLVPLSSSWAALSLVITVIEMTIVWLRFSFRDSNLVCNSEMDRTRELNGWMRGVQERARLGGRGCTTEIIHVGMWCWIRHSPVICSPSYRPIKKTQTLPSEL